MRTKRASYLAPVILLGGGAFFTFVAISYLDGVSSHGWRNVWQTGSVGLLMLIFGVVDLWWGARPRRDKHDS